MSENIIEVRNLSKKFRNHHAVKNVSFDLKRGEIKGILGANGAGKTTTITMLLGLLTPTSGSIKILSTDISKDRYKILNKINFSSPYVDLPKKLTVRQNLYVYGMLYGIKNINQKIKNVAKELDFHDTFLAADYSHPGDNIPPILAVAQQKKSTGLDLIKGILTGYEIQVNLVKGICLHEHKIDHIAHLGPSVAAGLGTLLKLDTETIFFERS